MDSIVIESTRLLAAHRKFDYLIELTRLRPTHPKRCLAIIAPSQTGKTTIIDSYVRRLNTAEAITNGDIPALVVTLGANLTPRQFAQSILRAFEDHGFNALTGAGTEFQLMERAKVYLAERKVRILILDEFHHLVHSDNDKVIMSVSEAVKHLLNRGSCPIVVAGLRKAKRPFDANRQLAERAEPHMELHALDPANGAHREMFKTFLTDHLVAADRLQAAGSMLSLLGGQNAGLIWEVSRGVLGAACNLFKDAVTTAAEDGRWHMSQNDLIIATDHVIGKKLYDRNPFRDGAGPIRPLCDQ